MGYLHIENLYRPAAQTLLLFKRLYALEKVHGTSAHVAWRDGKVLGLEVVPWCEVDCDLAALDALRDAPSEVAVRRGITEPKPREGIVLRPLVELTTSNGSRVIAKHKGAAFSETKSPRPVVDPAQLAVLTEAQAIADEWVTDERLRHVLGRVPDSDDIKATPRIIAAMIEDVMREGSGEFVDSRDARAAIGRKTAQMFKVRLTKRVQP